MEASDSAKDVNFLFKIGGVGFLTPKQQVMLLRFFWMALVTFHIGWVCGWLRPMGLDPPFVHSHEFSSAIGKLESANKETLDSVMSLGEEVHGDRNYRLEHDIEETRAKECHATTTDIKQVLANQLTDLVERYTKLNKGEQPRIPGCEES